MFQDLGGLLAPFACPRVPRNVLGPALGAHFEENLHPFAALGSKVGPGQPKGSFLDVFWRYAGRHSAAFTAGLVVTMHGHASFMHKHVEKRIIM